MVPDKFKFLLDSLKAKLSMGLPAESRQSVESDEVMWSKGPGFTILPYGLELAGVTPSPLLTVEPKTKKNCFKYFSGLGGFYKADIYGVSSTVIETEIYQVESGLNFSVRFDDDGEAIRASGLISEDGVPYLSCRLEDDGDYWCYEYVCDGGQIASMLVYATNSVPGTEIFVERDGEALTGLYFINDNSKVYVYKI